MNLSAADGTVRPVRRIVVAPHMDDESLGCGGLLAKYPDDSLVVVVADSGAVRAKEHEAALAALGVGDSVRLGLPDGHIGDDPRALVQALDEVFEAHRPHEVYLPYPSLHQDHIAAYEAGMRACRASMSVTHYFPPSVFVYDIAAYDVNLYQAELRWNVFESLGEEHIDAKVAACRAYATEIPDEVHAMTGLKEMAVALGHARLVRYAEQYALVRSIRP